MILINRIILLKYLDINDIVSKYLTGVSNMNFQFKPSG